MPGIGYMTTAVVSAHLDKAVSTYPALCARSAAADWKPGRTGGNAGYVRIGTVVGGGSGSPAAPRTVAFVTGGVHARELAPPDALVSFLEQLLAAYTAQNAIPYPSWTDPAGVVYDPFTIPWPWIRAIVENLDLYIAPLVNPDGRDFVVTNLKSLASLTTADFQTSNKFAKWRKNRRPAPAAYAGNPDAIGVDINRNFDIAWDFKAYYDPSVATTDTLHPTVAPNEIVSASAIPTNEDYVGDAKESEPETANVANLMRTKGVSFYLDVHAYGRQVYFPWGLDYNQTADPTQSFTVASWNGKREADDSPYANYQEFVPADSLRDSQALAQEMCDNVLSMAGGSDATAQRRSGYLPKQACPYPCTGTTADYCYSLWFTKAAAGTPIGRITSMLMEVGTDIGMASEPGSTAQPADLADGGFMPDYVKVYPKIEREVHVALWTFLMRAAGAPAQAPSDPLTPPAGP
jgi:Zinc carboxypeptidase